MLIVTLPLLFKVGFISYFVLNQDLITETYCVNTKSPELKCNGKCHLKKTVNLETYTEKDNPSERPNNQMPELKEIKELPIFFYTNYGAQVTASKRFCPEVPAKAEMSFPYLASKGRLYSLSVFHPPLF